MGLRTLFLTSSQETAVLLQDNTWSSKELDYSVFLLNSNSGSSWLAIPRTFPFTPSPRIYTEG